MRFSLHMFALVIAGVVLAALPGAADASSTTAVIRQSASTNAPGSAIAVTRDGAATIRRATSTRSARVSPALVGRLYSDLERAGALAELPLGHCMKSMSFGTTTVIAFAGQMSPDLQCAQNDIERTLAADASAIFEFVDRIDPQESAATK